MDFQLTEAQTLLQESARQMVARDIDPVLRAHDPDRPLPKAALLKIYAVLARQGLTAPRIPVEAGGSGMSMLDYGLASEQMPPVIALSLMAHECTIARIHFQIEDEQRQRFLPDLIAGRKICCTATTEPDSGSDPRAVRTSVV